MQKALKNTISYRLKYALQMRRLSATELSRLSKVPFSSISGYLSGKYQPKTKTLVIFADALGTTLTWLLGEVPLDEINRKFDNTDPMTQKLFSEYSKLSPEGKKLLLEIARTASESPYFRTTTNSSSIKNRNFFKEEIVRLKTENFPNKNIVILGALTGILAYLDEEFCSDSDGDKHLSIKDDVMKQFIYWKPFDLYLALTQEYKNRIRPKIKSLNSNAADVIDIVLVTLLDALDFIADWPVFPNLFNPEHRSTFMTAYFGYAGEFKIYIRKNSPELF